MEIFLSIIASYLAITFPGMAFFSTFKNRFGLSTLSTLSVIPITSIGITYVLVYLLNSVGLYFDLKFIFLILIFTSILWTLKQNVFALSKWKNEIFLVFPFITFIYTFFVWWAGYSGYNWIAPNSDGYNHNLYLSRILDLHSVIGSHVFTNSPLDYSYAKSTDFFFYPIGWHSAIAPAADLLGVPAPTMTLSSTLIMWAFVLPLGLIAISKLWFKSYQLVGPASAFLSQTIPLVPGVPMTWGAMPSVVGVALMPSILVLSSHFWRESTASMTGLNLAAITTLFFVHPPEAATNGIFFAFLFTYKIIYKKRRQLTRFAWLCLLPLAVVFWNWEKISIQVSVMKSLMGGNDRTTNETLGTFLNLSINTTKNQFVFGILVAIGFYFLKTYKKNNLPILFLLLTSTIYFISGSNSWPLEGLRIFTIPWYASYERAAWQLVPILSLIGSLPIVASITGLGKRSFDAVFAIGAFMISLVVLAQTSSGAKANLEIIRKGIQENQIAGPGSRSLFTVAKRLTDNEKGSLLIGNRGDGSAYAYMFENVPISNGAFGANGLPSSQIGVVLENIDNVCSINNLSQILSEEKVAGVILGVRRYAWETAYFSKPIIKSFEGTTVIAESEDLILLLIEEEKC